MQSVSSKVESELSPNPESNLLGTHCTMHRAVHCNYPFLLHLSLGLSGGAVQVVVVVAPADHLVPLLRARLGAVRALLRRDDLKENVYFKCLFFLLSFSYISVPHGFEAVGVPAGQGEAGAREAAQEAEADQSVHGILFLSLGFFVSVVALPADNC